MPAKLLQLTCLIVLAGLLGACESTGAVASATPADGETADPPRRARVGLIPQTRPPIRDIPVPIAFKLAEEISRTYESGGVRTVDHTYVGRDDKFEVERFYAEQMPLKDWVAKSKRMERGVITQIYEKGDEMAQVEIRDAKGLTTNRSSVHITVQKID